MLPQEVLHIMIFPTAKWRNVEGKSTASKLQPQFQKPRTSRMLQYYRQGFGVPVYRYYLSQLSECLQTSCGFPLGAGPPVQPCTIGFVTTAPLLFP
jgi:hypothetical protein